MRGPELVGINQISPPPQITDQVQQCHRHRRAPHDHHVRRRHHRLDEDLQRPVTLARDRNGHDTLGYVHLLQVLGLT